MVQRFDINQRKGLLQRLSKHLVGVARFGYTGGVIVRKDDRGSVGPKCGFHNFARINARLRQSTPEKPVNKFETLAGA